MVTLTWSGASEWDAAQSEDGVVHAGPTGADWSAAEIVQGPSVDSPPEAGSPVGRWPFHEDSGTTANDIEGTLDGSINGPTVGATGLLGTTCYSFDGSNDIVDMGNPPAAYDIDASEGWCVSFWYKTSSTSLMWVWSTDPLCLVGINDDSTAGGQAGYLRVMARDDGSSGPNHTHNVGSTLHDGNWHHILAGYTQSGTAVQAFFDGSQQGGTGGGLDTITFSKFGFGDDIRGTNHPYSGEAWDLRFYPGVDPSSTLATALYEEVATAGSYTAAKKVA